MKRICSFLLAVLILFTLIPSAAAAEDGLKHFRSAYTYENSFTDVKSDAWYYVNVKTSFEYGLVNGTSSTTFSPDDSITLAQTIVLACRLHSIYNADNHAFQQGNPWYQVYVDYALKEQILPSEGYPDYNAPATRAQFAVILASAFPSEALQPINSVSSLPDVPADSSYADKVFLLYNAGILTGNDSAGTFYPDSQIRRSEAAAIVTRMADPSLRKQILLGSDIDTVPSFTYSEVPPFSGSEYYVVNDNVPFFDASNLTTTSYETYSPLDTLGRCGPAEACVGIDLMPTESRGNIGSVRPSGWHTVTYSFVSGRYLYNRCHLIGYQLTAENANECNLITGTRYLNVDGMLPFENYVADYVKETENHVLYRVTPVFVGDDLVARGVLMEAQSIEDGGKSVQFNVFCYNVQPGVIIDYATGDSKESGTAPEENKPTPETTYILNTSSMKFHLPTCRSAGSISEGNRRETTITREELLSQGYSPCGTCKP